MKLILIYLKASVIFLPNVAKGNFNFVCVLSILNWHSVSFRSYRRLAKSHIVS